MKATEASVNTTPDSADNPDMQKCLMPLIVAVAIATLGAGQFSPALFQTTARFSVDANELPLTTAVAIVEPHRTVQGYSWLHVYFYAFPFTPEDVTGVTNGSVALLDQKQMRVAATANERNRSRAVLHLLVEKDSLVSNVSLEVPGVTCTIAETAEKVQKAFPEFKFDNQNVALQGSGAFECDLQSVGMGKRLLRWNVNVHVPVFQKR